MPKKVDKQQFFCAHCGQKIIGVGFPYKGNLYCSYKCANLAAAKDEENEKELNELYAYIKQEFNLSEISPMYLEIIQHSLQGDSGQEVLTINDIKNTLHYYIHILGSKIPQIKYLNWILRSYKDEAKKYYEKENTIREINKNIDINVAPVKLHLQKKLDKKQKIGYNIEDL